MDITTPHPYSVKEEIANSVSHGLGIFFSVVSLTILLVLSSFFGTITHTLCYTIYGISLLLLYTSSTLYHALPQPKAKRILKICDHVAIYLLIAGTYTPFLVLNIPGAWGQTLLAVIWGLAAVGVVFKLFFTGRFKYVSTLIYIGMGWLIMIAGGPLSEALDSSSAMSWLVWGGCMYTGGTVFYLLKKVPYFHSIWHLFVLSGSVFHFRAILLASGLI